MFAKRRFEMNKHSFLYKFSDDSELELTLLDRNTVRVIFGDVLIENKNQMVQVYEIMLDSQELCNVPLFNMGS